MRRVLKSRPRLMSATAAEDARAFAPFRGGHEESAVPEGTALFSGARLREPVSGGCLHSALVATLGVFITQRPGHEENQADDEDPDDEDHRPGQPPLFYLTSY